MRQCRPTFQPSLASRGDGSRRDSSALKIRLPAPIDIWHAEQAQKLRHTSYAAASKRVAQHATSATFRTASCARIAAVTSLDAQGTQSAGPDRLNKLQRKATTAQAKAQQLVDQRQLLPDSTQRLAASPGSPDTQHRHRAARLNTQQAATLATSSLSPNQAVTLRSGLQDHATADIRQ